MSDFSGAWPALVTPFTDEDKVECRRVTGVGGVSNR